MSCTIALTTPAILTLVSLPSIGCPLPVSSMLAVSCKYAYEAMCWTLRVLRDILHVNWELFGCWKCQKKAKEYSIHSWAALNSSWSWMMCAATHRTKRLLPFNFTQSTKRSWYTRWCLPLPLLWPQGISNFAMRSFLPFSILCKTLCPFASCCQIKTLHEYSFFRSGNHLVTSLIGSSFRRSLTGRS